MEVVDDGDLELVKALLLGAEEVVRLRKTDVGLLMAVVAAVAVDEDGNLLGDVLLLLDIDNDNDLLLVLILLKLDEELADFMLALLDVALDGVHEVLVVVLQVMAGMVMAGVGVAGMGKRR